MEKTINISGLKTFINAHCPRKRTYCNGQHMPRIENNKDKNRQPDRPPCEYFVKGKCVHPMNPKNNSVNVRKQLCKQIN
ncbi:MAG TPA: hypothetical protein VIO64_10865 [Pseudobacteroides sp.]|uniref:hypothetical protein n=1 Tax=Pseudobacteroides sp. TaxID=1968840 RepID=UPI002F923CD6